MDRLYTLSWYLVEQNRPKSHLSKHWRTHTLCFCRKPSSNSIQWLGHPIANHILLHCRRTIPCLNTLVGSVRYLFTLLKYSQIFSRLSFAQQVYIAELDPILTYCWGIPHVIILQNNSQIQYINELSPILTHCWGRPYLNTLLSNSELLIPCWAIPNPNTLLR